MKLEQSFTVEAPVEEVWAALVDVERVAPCLPGAELTGRDDEGAYQGSFSIKLGPTTAAYRGSLRMESADEATHTATMNAKGTDKRGQGGASATIVSTMSEEAGGTHVEVVTDFHITGRLARFGRSGMIEDISRRLMREFADCLQQTIAAAPAGAAAPAAAAAPAGDVPAEAAAGAAPSDDPAGLGTLGVPPPAEAGRQPPGATGGAGGPDRATEGPDRAAGASDEVADAAVASAGGAAAEAATAGAAPPGADELSDGPAAPAPPPPAPGAPAPPPDAGTTPPPPPGGPGGEVPTAGGAGGAPPPPRTGPPPPPGGRERHAPASGEEPAPVPAAPEPAAPAPEPPEPEPRTGSIPPPTAAPSPAPATPSAKPIGGLSLFFGALMDRLKRAFRRKPG